MVLCVDLFDFLNARRLIGNWHEFWACTDFCGAVYGVVVFMMCLRTSQDQFMWEVPFEFRRHMQPAVQFCDSSPTKGMGPRCS